MTKSAIATGMKTINQITEEVFNSFKKSAFDICDGFCGEFAAKVAIECEKNNIKYIILYTNNFAFKYDIEGLKQKKTNASNVGHCYIKVENKYYDAFDLNGCISQKKMQYINQY